MFSFLAGKMFWGGVLILWGLSFFVEKLLNVKFSLFRIVLGLILITLGVKLALNHNDHKDSEYKKRIFSEHSIEYKGTTTEYNILFDKGLIDLSTIKGRKDLSINVIFGSAEIIIPDTLCLDLQVRNVMGETIMPDKEKFSNGMKTYELNSSIGRVPLKVYLNNTMSTTTIKVENPRIQEHY